MGWRRQRCMQEALQGLVVRLGHRFKDESLLELALTHGSASPDPAVTNERLEFLGDAVLGAAVSEALYRRFPGEAEGKLTQKKSGIVSDVNLARVARLCGVGDCLRLGRGEDRNGGRDRTRILANALEAVFAAVYLDGGMSALSIAVDGLLLDGTEEDLAATSSPHGKTQLQEWLQARGERLPAFAVVAEEGPSHSRTYRIEVRRGALRGCGEGTRKKIAEEMAARELLARIRQSDAAATARREKDLRHGA